MTQSVKVQNLEIGNDLPLTIIGGINVLESSQLAEEVCSEFVRVCQSLSLPYIFKASFDKANRSSLQSARGPGLETGLKILADIKTRYKVPVITDFHLPEQAQPVANVCDVLQIPAFLCRQTDLLAAAVETGRPLHIKKLQFLAPQDMDTLVKKVRDLGGTDILLCERGTAFGYHNLLVDTLGFARMKDTGCPVTFDVTHALQLPGGHGTSAAGRGEHTLALARAGVSQGLAGLFLETHPNPKEALCDGESALPLDQLEEFLNHMKAMDTLIKEAP